MFLLRNKKVIFIYALLSGGLFLYGGLLAGYLVYKTIRATALRLGKLISDDDSIAFFSY